MVRCKTYSYNRQRFCHWTGNPSGGEQNFFNNRFWLRVEVGEHIPAPFEYAFMKNLLKSAGKMVILSWAVLGQGGIGHVNEQTAEQIVQKMRAWGWAKDEILTMDLKTAATIGYIKRNVQVFEPIVPK